MQLHRIEPHLHAKALGMVRHRPLGRKQSKLSMLPAPLVEPFDYPAPRRVLAIVDLAQIQNRTLHHTTARATLAFDNAPVTVFLAVLPSPCESQVHGRRFYAQTKSRKEGRSSLHAFPHHRPLIRFSFCRQNSKIRGRIGKVGLVTRTRGGPCGRRLKVRSGCYSNPGCVRSSGPAIERVATRPSGYFRTSRRAGVTVVSHHRQDGNMMPIRVGTFVKLL